MSAEIFQAVVVTGNDPLGQGRVKVAVPQVSGTSVSSWAHPTNRGPNPPAAGSVVWVSLNAGDPARPVYHSGVSSASNGGRIVCTSATPPPAPYPGMEIYETDTGNSLIYSGAGWVLQFGWTVWASLPGTLGTNWALHTAQYRTGPGGSVQVRGSLQKTVSPSAANDAMITLPSALWPSSPAPDLWWPCSYQPGSGTSGVTNVVLTAAGVIQQAGSSIAFSGGSLTVNVTPLSYSTI